ncbi:MAG TPA: AAA family ATPase, partial [Candidatus Limnocylindrales bacterium]|nr:AAA family ATPase [Candidatus Limnocylindrales bacterium]
PALVLLVGPSGAGKSTFASRNFSGTEILSSDRARELLSDNPSDQGASTEAFRVVGLIANGRLKRRLMTVIDATNLRAASRSGYRRLAARYGIPTVTIAFDLPTDQYALHNRNRPDRVVDDYVITDQAERMRDALLVLPDERYAALYVLRSPEEIAAAVIERAASRGRA